MAWRITGVCITGWVLGTAVAHAQSIPTGYQRVAMEYEVPPALLYAMALTESGQSALTDGQYRPWPWTLNVNGKGDYYPSRQSAWTALQRVLVDERTSVDIGLMQINWRYHQTALGSSWQALDPYHNLRVAADLLRDCFNKHSHWLKSVGCYHAPNDTARAERYSQRVKAQASRLTESFWAIDGGEDE